MKHRSVQARFPISRHASLRARKRACIDEFLQVRRVPPAVISIPASVPSDELTQQSYQSRQTSRRPSLEAVRTSISAYFKFRLDRVFKVRPVRQSRPVYPKQ